MYHLNKLAVHLWMASLKQPRSMYEQMISLLPSDETARMNRFHHKKQQDYFGFGRGLLRLLLSHYLNCDPQRLKFSYSRYAKPELAFPCLPLRFNVSHAKHKIIIGLCLEDAIGVDIEYQGQHHDILAIAKRYFDKDEYLLLTALPPRQQRRAFYDAWTRKEAIIKAIGTGLFSHLRSNLMASIVAAVTHQHHARKQSKDWTFFSPSLFHGYKAAVAVKKKEASLFLHTWPHIGVSPSIQ